MANGPPAWLSAETVLLEVIRPDQQSGVATLDRTTGAITVTDAQGFGPSPTRDGSQVAVLGTSGVVIAEATGWLAGDPIDAPALAPPVDSTVLDVALDGDGTRLAVVYAASSGAAASVVILRRDGAVWESVTTIPVAGDEVVSIDWLSRPPLSQGPPTWASPVMRPARPAVRLRQAPQIVRRRSIPAPLRAA